MFTFSERFACPVHGPSLKSSSEPRIFSVSTRRTAPATAARGSARRWRSTPKLVVPRPRRWRSVRARSRRGRTAHPTTTSRSPRRSPSATRRSTSKRPGQELAQEQRSRRVPERCNGRRAACRSTYRNRYGRHPLLRDAFRGHRQRTSNAATARLDSGVGCARRSRSSCRCAPAPPVGGARRCGPSRARCLVADTRIEDFCALSARRALEWLQDVELSETDRHVARLILREISERLQFLENVGIGYLSMDRAAATLSGGEAQRIRLATQIGSSLVGVLYILDEPSIGLHQRDNSKLIGTLERLRDLGNTVIVVEHDEQTMRAADHLVDMGLGAGEHGGRIVAQGTAAEVERGQGVAHGPVPVRRRARSRCRRDGAPRAARRRDPRRQPAQPARHRREGPARRADVCDGGLGLGQVDARQRRALLGSTSPTGCIGPASGPGRIGRFTASSSSTRSSRSTSRRSGARHARTRPRTRACST